MSTSTPQPVQTLPTLPAQPFRLDVPLHDLLQKPPDHPTLARAKHEPQTSFALPSPVFPQHPMLLMKWLWKQAMNGFQGVTGSFE